MFCNGNYLEEPCDLCLAQGQWVHGSALVCFEPTTFQLAALISDQKATPLADIWAEVRGVTLARLLWRVSCRFWRPNSSCWLLITITTLTIQTPLISACWCTLSANSSRARAWRSRCMTSPHTDGRKYGWVETHRESEPVSEPNLWVCCSSFFYSDLLKVSYLCKWSVLGKLVSDLKMAIKIPFEQVASYIYKSTFC